MTMMNYVLQTKRRSDMAMAIMELSQNQQKNARTPPQMMMVN